MKNDSGSVFCQQREGMVLTFLDIFSTWLPNFWPVEEGLVVPGGSANNCYWTFAASRQSQRMSASLHVSNTAREIGISPDHLVHYGSDKAKVSLDALQSGKASGKLILVSAITPTPAGEGKTTVSVGLAQGLRKINRSVALALRQPSMGPVFGRKGGATGGGRAHPRRPVPAPPACRCARHSAPIRRSAPATRHAR